MRILLLHPNCHSGGAEIAGNWPPAWVAYLTGYLKAAGYADVHFVDAMTHHLSDEQVRARIVELQPDVVGCAVITSAIYKAEGLLQIAKQVNPAIVTVLGGIHGTFMYPQVLTEAPWIDAVVRGEGEQVPRALPAHLLRSAACVGYRGPGRGRRRLDHHARAEDRTQGAPGRAQCRAGLRQHRATGWRTGAGHGLRWWPRAARRRGRGAALTGHAGVNAAQPAARWRHACC